MERISVTVQGENGGTKRYIALLPVDLKVEQLIPALVEKMDLPLTDNQGNFLDYQIVVQDSNKVFNPSRTLVEEGVVREDVLLLVPKVKDLSKQRSSTIVEKISPTALLSVVEDIEKAVENTPFNGPGYPSAFKQLRRMIVESSTKLVAPITIPSTDGLTVHLVPGNLVDSYKEYMGEQKKWENISNLLVGALLGIVVNWTTQSPNLELPNEINIQNIVPSILANAPFPSMILMGLLFIFLVITWTSSRKFQSKVEKMWTQIEYFGKHVDSNTISNQDSENV